MHFDGQQTAKVPIEGNRDPREPPGLPLTGWPSRTQPTRRN